MKHLIHSNDVDQGNDDEKKAINTMITMVVKKGGKERRGKQKGTRASHTNTASF